MIAVLLVLPLLLLLLGGLLGLLGTVAHACLAVVSALLSGQSLRQQLIATQIADDFKVNFALVLQVHNLSNLIGDDLVLGLKSLLAVAEAGSENLASVDSAVGVVTALDGRATVLSTSGGRRGGWRLLGCLVKRLRAGTLGWAGGIGRHFGGLIGVSNGSMAAST